MANTNEKLKDAKLNKQDEFYTRLEDIENEMRHYRKHFKGKTVLCNCDDPFESNFFKYFVLNFNRLGLKKLIATCYSGSPIAGRQLSLFDVIGDECKRDTPYKAIVTNVYDITGDGGIDMFDVAELFKQGDNTLEELKGNGDYRSPECLELMDEADIVVTNPPFSLFREYVQTLLEHKKKFIIIGSFNAITYKEVFPHLRDNELWLGYGFNAGNAFFYVPDHADTTRFAQGVYNPETGLVKFRNCCWFTNLDIKKRHEETILIKRYDPNEYPSYSNYDGIEVSKLSDIPCDYAGDMGVPMTFLEIHNPDQFEIIGLGMGDLAKEIGITRNHEGRTKLEYQCPDGSFKRPYSRVVVRNKHPELPKEK